MTFFTPLNGSKYYLINSSCLNTDVITNSHLIDSHGLIRNYKRGIDYEYVDENTWNSMNKVCDVEVVRYMVYRDGEYIIDEHPIRVIFYLVGDDETCDSRKKINENNNYDPKYNIKNENDVLKNNDKAGNEEIMINTHNTDIDCKPTTNHNTFNSKPMEQNITDSYNTNNYKSHTLFMHECEESGNGRYKYDDIEEIDTRIYNLQTLRKLIKKSKINAIKTLLFPKEENLFVAIKALFFDQSLDINEFLKSYYVYLPTQLVVNPKSVFSDFNTKIVHFFIASINTKRKYINKGGLSNLGNTCFMNSSLQCLASLEEFSLYFTNGKYKNDGKILRNEKKLDEINVIGKRNLTCLNKNKENLNSNYKKNILQKKNESDLITENSIGIKRDNSDNSNTDAKNFYRSNKKNNLLKESLKDKNQQIHDNIHNISKIANKMLNNSTLKNPFSTKKNSNYNFFYREKHVSDEFSNLLTELQRKDIFFPVEFRKVFTNKVNKFGDYQEHDAAEFIETFLDYIHEELKDEYIPIDDNCSSTDKHEIYDENDSGYDSETESANRGKSMENKDNHSSCERKYENNIENSVDLLNKKHSNNKTASEGIENSCILKEKNFIYNNINADNSIIPFNKNTKTSDTNKQDCYDDSKFQKSKSHRKTNLSNKQTTFKTNEIAKENKLKDNKHAESTNKKCNFITNNRKTTLNKCEIMKMIERNEFSQKFSNGSLLQNNQGEKSFLSFYEYIKKNNSIISRLFHGQFISSLKCLECANTSYSYDPFVILTLPVPENKKFHPFVILTLFNKPPFKLKVENYITVKELKIRLAYEYNICDIEVITLNNETKKNLSDERVIKEFKNILCYEMNKNKQYFWLYLKRKGKFNIFSTIFNYPVLCESVKNSIELKIKIERIIEMFERNNIDYDFKNKQKMKNVVITRANSADMTNKTLIEDATHTIQNDKKDINKSIEPSLLSEKHIIDNLNENSHSVIRNNYIKINDNQSTAIDENLSNNHNKLNDNDEVTVNTNINEINLQVDKHNLHEDYKDDQNKNELNALKPVLKDKDDKEIDIADGKVNNDVNNINEKNKINSFDKIKTYEPDKNYNKDLKMIYAQHSNISNTSKNSYNYKASYTSKENENNHFKLNLNSNDLNAETCKESDKSTLQFLSDINIQDNQSNKLQLNNINDQENNNQMPYSSKFNDNEFLYLLKHKNNNDPIKEIDNEKYLKNMRDKDHKILNNNAINVDNNFRADSITISNDKNTAQNLNKNTNKPLSIFYHKNEAIKNVKYDVNKEVSNFNDNNHDEAIKNVKYGVNKEVSNFNDNNHDEVIKINEKSEFRNDQITELNEKVVKNSIEVEGKVYNKSTEMEDMVLKNSIETKETTTIKNTRAIGETVCNNNDFSLKIKINNNIKTVCNNNNFSLKDKISNNNIEFKCNNNAIIIGDIENNKKNQNNSKEEINSNINMDLTGNNHQNIIELNSDEHKQSIRNKFYTYSNRSINSLYKIFSSDNKTENILSTNLYEVKNIDEIFMLKKDCYVLFNDNIYDELFGKEFMIEKYLNINKEKLTLYDCLNLFMYEELLINGNRVNCSTCNTKTNHYKKMELNILPKFLIIQIKRFSYEKGVDDKIRDFIDFPEVFYIGEIVYDLKSVCNHIELSFSCGHYTSYVKKDKWLLYNDSVVSEKENLKKENGYILFYQM
ncbi:hypothetical protein COBT_000611, partial [Conglomerata obtusa]